MVSPSIGFNFKILNLSNDIKIIVTKRNFSKSLISMREKIKLQNPSNYKLIFLEKLKRLFVRSFIDFQNHLTIKKQFLFELDLDKFKQNYRSFY